MKGISLIERHFEKAGFVLVTVLIGSYILVDFINPATIQMGLESNATTKVVNSLLIAQATSLKQSQDSTTSSIDLSPVVSGLAQKNFNEKLNANILPSLKIRQNSPSFAGEIMNPTIKLLNTLYYQPRFAAPKMVSPVEWLSDAIEPEEASKIEPLQKFLDARPDSKNMDVIWTKPVARVDLKGIRAELAKSVAEAAVPQIAAPAIWRNNTIYFIDVVFERQRKMEDGTWGELVTVPILLGRAEKTFRDRDIKGWDANRIFSEMRGEKLIENQIRQPDFYPTRYNSGRKDPSTSLAKSGGVDGTTALDKKKQQEALKQKEQLDALEKELKIKESELQSAGGEWDAELAKKEAERKKNIKKKPGDSADASDDSPTDLKLRSKLTLVVRDLRTKLKRLKKDFGIESPKSDVATVANPVESATEADLDSIDVWTHDLSVTPGETVRYRCRVEIFNPFFSRARQLVKEQIGLATNLAIPSQTSDWSAPVHVPTKAMFFAENGALGEKGTKQTISFSVYVLRNGLWEKMDPNPQFEPGQPLLFSIEDSSGNSDDNFEIQTGLFVADIFEDLNAMPEKNRATLPGVVISPIDHAGKFVIRYPYQDKLDPDQTRLKKLVEDGKNAKPLVKSAG